MAAVAQAGADALARLGGERLQLKESEHTVLQVVGGTDKGGIVVRRGKGTSSSELDCRLATGALIKVLERDGGRIRFEKLTGDGPEAGWVSERAAGRELLSHTAEAAVVEAKFVAGEAARKLQAQAISVYGKRLMEGREANINQSFPGFNRTAFPLWQAEPQAAAVPESLARAQLRRDLGEASTDEDADRSSEEASTEEAPVEDDGADSDGEVLTLCKECRLPIGQFAYAAENGDDRECLMHGECKAQWLLKDMREKETSRREREAELKRARHEAFDIGWSPAAIPRNAATAAKLGCGFEPRGLCCLVLQGDRVEVAPTLEPAAAVSLEYLALALRCRRSEGTEPLFSLDPVAETKASDDPERSMQMKRFEPEWLAGTSVGEVMFQADYHLKELSMGEYEQPVVGMKSCFDHTEAEKVDEEWSGREWFIVRKAEMHISEDKVLVPFLKLGVEAREQVIGPDGCLEDAPVTRPSHPLVRYAEAFTQSFDLIAERKGVVYQLREVAKASIMAKYLMESGLRVNQSWFSLESEVSPAYCMEIPQLWNDRCVTRICVEDGQIVDEKKEKGVRSRRHGIYGGVDFGIDRFRLTAPSRVATSVVAGRAALGRPASSLMATTAAGLAMGPARQFARLAGPLAPSAMSLAAPSRVAAPISAMGLAAPLRAGLAGPQGVDLNLDKFNLSATTEATGELRTTDAALAVGAGFWAELAAGPASKALSDEDCALFKDVFNPYLSDRRVEGDDFAPPPTSYAHMQSLKRLVKEEEAVRLRRKTHFFSSRFDVEDAGDLFPSSWTHTVQSGAAQSGALRARPEYAKQADLLRDLIASSSAPSFDRRTEDGMRFRIYRLGSLEVRTAQAHDGEEEIGAVFSIEEASHLAAAAAAAGGAAAWYAAAAAAAKAPRAAADQDRVAKVTEYVERRRHGAGTGARASFVVLEAEGGGAVVTEEREDGAVTWQVNPADLEIRTSLAKVIRSAECLQAGVKIGDLKGFQLSQDGRDWPKASISKCKRYAQFVYCKASGEGPRPASGFLKKASFAQPWIRCPRPRYGLRG